jgi:hypothetical protein
MISHAETAHTRGGFGPFRKGANCMRGLSNSTSQASRPREPVIATTLRFLHALFNGEE